MSFGRDVFGTRSAEDEIIGGPLVEMSLDEICPCGLLDETSLDENCGGPLVEMSLWSFGARCLWTDLRRSFGQDVLERGLLDEMSLDEIRRGLLGRDVFGRDQSLRPFGRVVFG